MDLERHDLGSDSPARALLLKQGRLVDVQVEREAEGVKLARLTRLRERIKAIRDLSLAAVVLLLLGALAWVALDARRAQGLVVEPISVPPDLVERGMTSQVVAARLLDRLAAIQERSASLRASRSFRSDWGDEVRVELPQTGVSVSEAHRWLRRTLGKETFVTGEVVRIPGGLAVSARNGARPAHVAQGPDAELGRLLQEVAEALFKQTQPFQFASYLSNTGRRKEALALAEDLARAGPDAERAWAYGLISNLLFRDGDEPGALRAARAAVRLAPDSPMARGLLAFSELRLGHDGAALDALRTALRQSEGRALEEIAPELRERSVLTLRRLIGELTGDFGGAAEELREDAAADAVTLRADYLARNHDVAGATGLLERGAAGSDAERLRYAPGGDIMLPDYNRAAALDDWPRALRSISETEAAVAALPPQAAPLLDEVVGRFIRPRRAYALARTGDHAGAAAVVAATPTDCILCLRMRGRTAALAGRPAEADRWFAQAIRIAPALPFAYAEWAQAKLSRRDAGGALELLRQAQERGPRWADPFKLEGDIRAGAGDHRAAVRLYAAAAERAPQWGALHLAWGSSLQALGERDQAKAAFARASRMDLSAADRARLSRTGG